MRRGPVADPKPRGRATPSGMEFAANDLINDGTRTWEKETKMSPRPDMALLLAVLLALTVLVDACFLNSCPYRRMGRSQRLVRTVPADVNVETCGTCGGQNNGVCVSEGVCCSTGECHEDRDCLNLKECPLPLCIASGQSGFCVTSTLCCADKVCQRSLQCMMTAARALRT